MCASDRKIDEVEEREDNFFRFMFVHACMYTHVQAHSQTHKHCIKNAFGGRKQTKIRKSLYLMRKEMIIIHTTQHKTTHQKLQNSINS